MQSWLEGKKTYLLAAVLALVAIALLMTGHMTPVTMMGLVMAAATGFPVTFRAALERHQQEEMALLEKIAWTGAAVAGRNLPQAGEQGVQVIKAAVALATEIHSETAGVKG